MSTRQSRYPKTSNGTCESSRKQAYFTRVEQLLAFLRRAGADENYIERARRRLVERPDRRMLHYYAHRIASSLSLDAAREWAMHDSLLAPRALLILAGVFLTYPAPLRDVLTSAFDIKRVAHPSRLMPDCYYIEAQWKRAFSLALQLNRQTRQAVRALLRAIDDGLLPETFDSGELRDMLCVCGYAPRAYPLQSVHRFAGSMVKFGALERVSRGHRRTPATYRLLDRQLLDQLHFCCDKVDAIEEDHEHERAKELSHTYARN